MGEPIHIDDAIAEARHISRLRGSITSEWLGIVRYLRKVVSGEIVTDERKRADRLQAELDEIRSMATNRPRIHGQCQCYLCTNDMEGLSEYAAAKSMNALAEKERADTMTRALAKTFPRRMSPANGYKSVCMFCGHESTGDGHTDDCVWVAARKWVEDNPENPTNA